MGKGTMNAIGYLVAALRTSIAASLLCAPFAHGDDVHSYLRVLHSKDIHADSGDGALVAAGQAVCEKLSAGHTPDQAAEWVYAESRLNSDESGNLVGAAIAGLCPEYSFQLSGYTTLPSPQVTVTPGVGTV